MANMETYSERASSISILLPFVLAPPEPATGLSEADLQHSAFGFSGIIATVVEPPPPQPIDTGSLIAFQPNAFQTNYPGELGAFQGFDRDAVAVDFASNRAYFVDFFVEGHMSIHTYEQGGLVSLTVEVKDPTESPPLLFDPSSVKISLINPNATVVVNQANMSKLSRGKYGYFHQLDNSSIAGSWYGFVTVTNGSHSFQTIPQVLFLVV